MINIRQAAPSDSLLLSGLCVDVQQLHVEHQPHIFKPPSNDDFAEAFFDEMFTVPTNTIYIAEENGEALGYVFCKLIERPETPFTFATRYLLIDQISVRPGTQRRGAGTALMRRVEKLAQALNISRIQLDSWAFNVRAHAFFEKLGFEKFDHRFWRNL